MRTETDLDLILYSPRTCLLIVSDASPNDDEVNTIVRFVFQCFAHCTRKVKELELTSSSLDFGGKSLCLVIDTTRCIILGAFVLCPFLTGEGCSTFEASGGFDIPEFVLSSFAACSTSFVEALGDEGEEVAAMVVGAVEADSDVGGVRVGELSEATEVDEAAFGGGGEGVEERRVGEGTGSSSLRLIAVNPASGSVH